MQVNVQGESAGGATPNSVAEEHPIISQPPHQWHLN
jgi:hypothetical protein